MIVKIDKSFTKDTDNIKDKRTLAKIDECIEQVQASNSPLQIKNLKKLKGFSHPSPISSLPSKNRSS